MEPAGQELQLRDFARTLRKRWRLFFSVIALVLLIAGLQAFLGPQVYRSQIKVEVQQQSNFIIRSEPTPGGSSRLTPATQAEYVRSDPYRALSSAIATLAEGYGVNLVARRTPDDMYALIDRDLFRFPLPKYFGYLALRQRAQDAEQSGGSDALARQYRELAAAGPEGFQARYISSVEKDEAVKQAGALAALSLRLKQDPFRLSASEVEEAAKRVLADPSLRKRPHDPLDGRRWEQLPLRERGPAVEAVYRTATDKHPDALARKAKRDRLVLRELKEPGMLEIAYETWDAERSRRMANAIACVVVWKNLSSLKAEAEMRRRHLQEQLWGAGGSGGGLASRLERFDERFRQFRIRAGVADLRAEVESRTEQLTSLRQIMDRRESEIQALRSEVASLQAALKRTPSTLETPTDEENPALASAKGALLVAKAELAEAAATYKPDSPRVEALRAKVRDLEDSLRREEQEHPTAASRTRGASSVYQELQRDLATAQAKLSGALSDQEQNRRQYEALRAELLRIPNRERQVSQLNRERSTGEDAYKMLAAQYHQAFLDEASKQPTARIVETALDPGKKVRPRRLVSLALGLVLGILLGLAAVAFAEGQDTRVRTREQAGRALSGVPLLGAIPKQATGPSPLSLAADGQLPISEAYRSLRSSLQFASPGQRLRTLVVTSAGLGEGKSTTVANLAVAMSRAGASVIVVDGDLRNPTLHRLFGASAEPGLTEVLAGGLDAAQALQPTGVPGVRLLACGPVPPNPSALVDSPAMRQVLERLAEEADVVLIDSPAALAVTDAAVLGSMADGTLLVLGSGQVARDAAAQARQVLTQAQARVIGTVLNRADDDRGRPTYGPSSASGRAGHKSLH